MQHEMFAPPPFKIAPERGRKAPPLWIRRLAIVSEPGRIIRDVTLRPGLNVIWSPDPGIVGTQPIGHGGGKTMLCRFLRFCLGEDSFAPDGQRRRVWDKFPAGSVGAEVMVDDECWIVWRSLGRSESKVLRGAPNVEAAFSAEAVGVDIEEFRKMLGARFMTDVFATIPPSIGAGRAWEAALAWASRDQECRFGHALEWRDRGTDSRSPVRGRSIEDILLLVRALIGALLPEELIARDREIRLAGEIAAIRSDLASLEWQIKRTVARLGRSDPNIVTTGPLDAAAAEAATEQKLRLALQIPEGTPIDLRQARERRDTARAKLRAGEEELTNLAQSIELAKRDVAYAQAQLATASAKLQAAGTPVCPICKVRIDTVLAEGCKIALDECDLESLRQNEMIIRKQIDDTTAEIQSLERRRDPLKYDITSHAQALESLESSVRVLEHELFERSRAVREAEKLLESVKDYRDLLAEREDRRQAENAKEALLALVREEVAAQRNLSAGAVAELSRLFGAVVRELVPGDVEGRLTLDGNGLGLRVELGGERSTAAIDSWKVIAFDLAALARSVEGKTHLPSFLIHDSPREADLGMSLYARLFAFVRKLEEIGPSPLFQYIVTTTTEPPAEFQAEPWLRLRLQGAPPENRLLGVDL